jgi:hypothetical protein
VTDKPEQPGLPDELDASVRALLGEARVDEPMPAEVADRIERALVDARPPRADATVVRFRRRMAGGLVAAAIVVVGGGLLAAQLHGTSGAGEDRATSGSVAAQDSGGRAEKSAPNVLPGATPRAPLSGTRARLPRLRSTHFAADVATLVDQQQLAAQDAPAGKSPATDGLRGTGKADCATPFSVPQGADVREVTLDGRLATLVVDPPGASPREATAYSCDGGRELASAVLPD